MDGTKSNVERPIKRTKATRRSWQRDITKPTSEVNGIDDK